MARVTSTFLESFKPMNTTSLQAPVVFVVDMINGFVKKGALHDEAILSCVKPIQDILSDVVCPTFFVADAHPLQAREFNSFPTHCIKGSSESELIDELQPFVKTMFYKNSTNAFFSPQFQSFLQSDTTYQDVVLVGCCSDICILQFALSLNAYFNEHNMTSKRIVIPIDAIDTYHIENVHDALSSNEFAIANMQANGIHVVCSLSRSEE